ncbi:MAG: exo-alpha-sialidase [Thermoguttaceae bacterium]|nr:exo-alpha-sialidase [Thermoguttaceae bacterium]
MNVFRPHSLSRRDMLKGSALGAAAFLTSFGRAGKAGAEPPAFEILSTKAVSETPAYYYGWPTVGVTKDDELIVAVSGGREGHVCPFGRVDLFRSRDKGETWSWPQTIYDGPSDDRDAGVLVTDKGTILVTSFTSLAYYNFILKAEIERRAKGEKQMSDEQYDRWMKVHERIGEQERRRELGSWIFRSTDDGVNWEKRHRVPINSNHGPFQLKSGRLLYAGIEMWDKERADFFEQEKAAGATENPSGNHVCVWYSDDDGKSWAFLSAIPEREGDTIWKYYELHGVEAEDGTIIVQIRNHNANNDQETLQCESSDGGKTWTTPHSIGVWGLPSHLWRLHDGRLLMTYGHRRAPLGQYARLSDDCGKSWSEPMYIGPNEISGDLGYPSTVQLSDGSLVSVWYETPAPGAKAIVKMARWVLK